MNIEAEDIEFLKPFIVPYLTHSDEFVRDVAKYILQKKLFILMDYDSRSFRLMITTIETFDVLKCNPGSDYYCWLLRKYFTDDQGFPNYKNILWSIDPEEVINKIVEIIREIDIENIQR